MLHTDKIETLRQEMDKAYKERRAAYELMKELGQQRSKLGFMLSASWKIAESAEREVTLAREPADREWNLYLAAEEDLSYQLYVVAEEFNRAHRAMNQALALANAAKRSEDMAEANRHSREGERYKNDRSSFATEMCHLVTMLETLAPSTNAIDTFQKRKAAYSKAMRYHKRLQTNYNTARTKHEIAQYDFFCAQENFNSAREAYHQALKADKANWVARFCKNCGEKLYVHTSWEHPPNYCEDCKITYQTRYGVN
ncbi:MAG: hypothetical protein ACOX0Z_00480 [Candidatus Nanosyncoccaceae bacterium]